MAAEDKIPIEIDIDSKHDPKGVNDAKNGFAGLENSINSVSRKAEVLGKIMRGLGFIAIIQQAVAIYETIRDRINAVSEAAKKLDEQQAEKKSVKALEDQKTAWDNLKTSIAAVNAQLARRAELESIAKGGERGIEDARSLVSEQTDLAGIAFDDPERKEKEDAVRARYARSRAITAASRTKDDALIKRQNLGIEAETKNAAAASIDEKAAETEKQLAAERAQAKDWRAKERALLQPADFKLIGLSPLLSYYRSKERIKESQDAGTRAGVNEKRADDLERLLADQRGQASGLRGDADQAQAKADAIHSEYQAGDIRVQASDMESGRAVRSSDAAVVAARDKRIADAKAKSDAIAAKEREAAEARARAGSMTSSIDSMRGRVRSEERDVYEAEQSEAALSPRQRRGKEGRDAAAALTRQRDELRQANAALAAAVSSMGDAIAEAFSVAKSAEAAAKQLKSRQNNTRTDAGNID